MLGQNRDHDGRIFRSLALVNRHGIGRDQRVELAKAIGDSATVETGAQFAGVKIDIVDIADIAVIDLFVVIVLDLHDFVAGSEGPAETLDLAFAGGVQGGLEIDIQRTRATAAPVHRA